MKNKKKFDAVLFMREQRDLLTLKFSEMTQKEILDYFEKNKFKNEIKPCT